MKRVSQILTLKLNNDISDREVSRIVSVANSMPSTITSNIKKYNLDIQKLFSFSDQELQEVTYGNKADRKASETSVMPDIR